MKFHNLRARLATLEQRVAEALPPWPLRVGSFGHCLWSKLGRPEKRRGFMEMYQQRAAEFYKEQK